MALKHAILASLAHGEASGYDLGKAFDASVANYWTATPQQLYRELDRLAEAGLVSARTVEQTKRPNKRVFTLTEAGLAELRRFTTLPPRSTAVRDELLIQMDALAVGDEQAVIGHVAAKLETAEAKLARYRQLRARALGDRTETAYLAEEPAIGPYLTLARGIRFEEENVAWCTLVLEALAARTSDPSAG